MMRITKLVINRFRLFRPGETFSIGECVTLISGLNGTAKSTLLGMICQPIGLTKKKAKSAYTRVYDDVDIDELKTLSSAPFKAQYSDVFRVSQKFDKPRTHEYTLYLAGDAFDPTSDVGKSGLNVRSEERKDQQSNKLRFVTNSDDRDPGMGNFPHPVIYLGLERLRPLAAIGNITINEEELPSDEKAIWDDIYKSVMSVHPSENISTEQLDTGASNKRRYQTVRTEYFDGESASAGQDNLGQIISALLSFYRLKKTLGNAYQGGVLLVDEFDATLHPAAQIALLKKFVQYAKELDLQILSTTHSIFALEQAYRSLRHDVVLLYLEKKNGQVVLHNNVSYDFIRKNLAHLLPPDRKNATITIIFEDSVSATFFKQVTGNVFSKIVAIYNAEENNAETAIPNDIISTIGSRLACKNIPDFNRLVFVMDPDSHHLLNQKARRLVALPGNHSIEREVYDVLFHKDRDDPFWDRMDYTWDICFSDYNDIETDRTLSSAQERARQYKKWFRERIVSSGRFGRCGIKAFQEWRKQHICDTKTFCESFLLALKTADANLVAMYSQEISDKLAKQFPAKGST